MSSAFESLESFDPGGWYVLTALMKNQASGVARAVCDESYLCVDYFQEEVLLALGENLDFRLVRGLLKQVIAFSGDRDGEIRGQLIGTYVAIEQLWIDSDLLMFLRWC